MIHFRPPILGNVACAVQDGALSGIQERR